MTEEEINYVKENLSYDPDTGTFWWKIPLSPRRMNKPAGREAPNGYIDIGLNYKKFYAHRLAFVLMGKELPDYVDHINGVKNDNRWCNLRPACKRKNGTNSKRSIRNTSGYKGVSLHKPTGKWRSYIRFNNKQTHLGLFDCPKGAHEAYRKAADKYYKEFKNYG